MSEPFPPGCAKRYRHMKLLARGGFGAVHLAVDTQLHREVAIKLLHNDELADPGSVERFLAEAKVTAALSHPAIVRLLDHDVEDGTPWIAYELLDGRSLNTVMREGPMPWRTAATMGAQVAEALHAAHALGVIHRDIKPANIMESGPGHWKLTDFGVARWTAVTRMLTHTGEVVGTVGYIAPELMYGGEPSAASDIFALGVTLYELILGQHPYEGNIVRLLQMQADEVGWIPAPATRVNGLPAALDAALVKAMSRDPAERFEDAGAFARVLQSALLGRAGAASRPTPVASRALPKPRPGVSDPGAIASGPRVAVTDPSSGIGRARPWMVALAFTLVGAGLGVGGMLLTRPRSGGIVVPVREADPAPGPRAVLSTGDQVLICAALGADARYFQIIRPKTEALTDVMIKGMADKLREIERQAGEIVDADVAAAQPLLVLRPRLPLTRGLEDTDLTSADLSRRLEKAILWHTTRTSRFRQVRALARRLIASGDDNMFGSGEFALGYSEIGHERSVLEPARRWAQRAIQHLELVDGDAPDESVRSLCEDLEHMARFLGPATWRKDALAEWERIAAPLRAALGRPANPCRLALGTYFTKRISALWSNKAVPPHSGAEMEAQLSALALLQPKWHHTLNHLRVTLAR